MICFQSHSGHVVASLDKTLYDDCYLCLGQGRRQLREIGGTKSKSGGQSFFIIPELDWGKVSVKIRWSPKKRSSPKLECFFWPKSHLNVFSAQKHVISKKKKVFVKIGRLFLPKISNSNVFFGQNQQLFPSHKIPWGAEINRGGEQERKSEKRKAPLPPRWRRAWLGGFEQAANSMSKNLKQSTGALDQWKLLSKRDFS